MEQKKELIKMKEEATEAMREAEEEIKKLLKLQKQIILMNNINAQNKEIAMTLDDFEENEKKKNKRLHKMCDNLLFICFCSIFSYFLRF